MQPDRFGYEWEKYNAISDSYRSQYEAQFRNWTHPLPPSFYQGKVILDAGCGMGRNSFWCLQWGVKRLVACDHDERSTTAARQTLRAFPQAEVVTEDLENLPWENEFDFIFSIGVIHHTRDPRRVMACLHRALQPNGEVLLWVYGREGFETVLLFLDPIRKYITSKLPLPLLHVLTYIVSVPLYIGLQVRQPKRPYFQQLRAFAFSHLHSILFDQLLPPIARYYTQQEARELARDFQDVHVYRPPNQNGWIVRGKK